MIVKYKDFLFGNFFTAVSGFGVVLDFIIYYSIE